MVTLLISSIRAIVYGKLKSFYIQKRPVDPEIIPPAKRIILNKYSIIGIIQATRGCPYRCEFCAMTNRRYGHIYRTRPIENVIEEMKSIPQKYLVFNDNSLTINPKYTKHISYGDVDMELVMVSVNFNSKNI